VTHPPENFHQNQSESVRPSTPAPADFLIATAFTPEELNTLSLVLSAADITHRVQYFSQYRMELYVPLDFANRAKKEIDAYRAENKNWPPALIQPATDLIFRAMSPLVIGLLMLFYNITGTWQTASDWFAKGAGDSARILSEGEPYRLITALTLHADLTHLLGNCVIGGLLMHFFLQLTGNGIGLLLMVVTATLANYLNVVVHGPGHHFVGFSTAIFSIIGMLCTMGFATKQMRYIRHFFMPIMAGLALLALLGSSGERTDLGAHLFGLLCGLVSGNIVRLPLFTRWRQLVLVQICCTLTAFGIVAAAWYLALA